MKFIAKKRPKAKEGFHLQEIDGEILLYSPETSSSIYLNATATVVWKLCTGEMSGQEIIDTLQENYSEESDTISDDVFETLKLFLKSNAIRLD